MPSATGLPRVALAAVPSSPATASAEGAQFNGRPSPLASPFLVRPQLLTRP
jgi:hypothetical protein